MPTLARKILIVAAIDGLIISPLHNSRTRSPPSKVRNSLKVEYGTGGIIPCFGGGSNGGAGGEREARDTGEHSRLEAHGIVGLLTVSPTNSFLIAITDRKQVAAVSQAHYPVYVITDVTLIPLSSRRDAARAIHNAAEAKRKASEEEEESGSSATNTDGGTDAEYEAAVDDEVQDDMPELGRMPVHKRSNSSIGEDVIGRKGAYGRFAARWFSKRGWTVDRRRSQGMSAEPVDDGILEVRASKKPDGQPAPLTTEGDTMGGDGEVEKKAHDVVEVTVTHSLTPKLLNTTRLLLAQSGSFYFSYDWDITRPWASQPGNVNFDLPLFKRTDPLYFWNHHLQKPFIDSGQHDFVLPLMQGFVAQTTFSMMPSSRTAGPAQDPEFLVAEESATPVATKTEETSPITTPTEPQKLILTLISRRSIRRAGLRYLRRGVDDKGHTANSVETEQLLSTLSWDHVFSYLQIRGSIPLFFSQSPYSLRPRPVLLLSDETNTSAMRLYFMSVRERYGDIHVVNLVEQHGSEAVVGDKYRDYVSTLNAAMDSDHQIGWTWFDFHKECRGMRFENVTRLFTEIGDELDKMSYTEDVAGEGIKRRQMGVLRTNCMDCLDRTNVVQSGSARRALEAQLHTLGVELRDDNTEWFNIIWADNGDAISKQYASTAALKGDFTRTRKRNLQGALTDIGLSMTRYFTNIISDFFTQAAIDFLLGNVTAQVFLDFEAEMISSDPAVSLRRARQNAVVISTKIVVADENEVVLGGWTFLSPREPCTRTGEMVEKVLLLTDQAVYLCDFDWALEKVSAFERVPVEDVVAVTRGVYITSTLAASHVDEDRNVGFVLRYRCTTKDIVRVNTRSLQSHPAEERVKGERLWAFKAIPPEISAGMEQIEVEKEVVEAVTREITGACGVEVKLGDVVGVEEARRGTGLVERWGYAVKRLVWA